MSYRPYTELVKAFIPTIIIIGATSVTWKICDLYEKKHKYQRPLLKIASGFPLYFFFLAMHFFQIDRYNKSFKRLRNMKLSRKC